MIEMAINRNIWRAQLQNRLISVRRAIFLIDFTLAEPNGYSHPYSNQTANRELHSLLDYRRSMTVSKDYSENSLQL